MIPVLEKPGNKSQEIVFKDFCRNILQKIICTDKSPQTYFSEEIYHIKLRTLLAGLIMFLCTVSSYAAETKKNTVMIGELEIENDLVFTDIDNITHVYLSYKKMAELADKIVEKIEKSEEKFKGLVSMPRGGLHPTLLLSQRLKNTVTPDRPLTINNIHLKSYNNDNQPEHVQVLVDLKLENNGEGHLFVDDLTDRGNTFQYTLKNNKNAKRACLVAKPRGMHLATFYGAAVPQETWIVFEYEDEGRKVFEAQKEEARLARNN